MLQLCIQQRDFHLEIVCCTMYLRFQLLNVLFEMRYFNVFLGNFQLEVRGGRGGQTATTLAADCRMMYMLESWFALMNSLFSLHFSFSRSRLNILDRALSSSSTSMSASDCLPI